jgi:hypothetical protein
MRGREGLHDSGTGSNYGGYSDAERGKFLPKRQLQRSGLYELPIPVKAAGAIDAKIVQSVETNAPNMAWPSILSLQAPALWYFHPHLALRSPSYSCVAT